jgi:hypothetical protein
MPKGVYPRVKPVWNKGLTRVSPIWNKGLTKEKDERVKRNAEGTSRKRLELFAEGKLKSWRKGLTIDTDERVAEAAKKDSKTMRERYARGEIKPWNKGKTKETDPIVKSCADILRGRISHFKGKTYEQIYGPEKARKLKQIRTRDIKKHREKLLRNLFKRPTSFEQKVIDVIEKYSLPFRYVGDGKIWIDRNNPDFINNNGQKLLIEVANRVKIHHSEDYEKRRTGQFAEYGFATLFLRDEDILRDDWELHILNKINQFNGTVIR